MSCIDIEGLSRDEVGIDGRVLVEGRAAAMAVDRRTKCSSLYANTHRQAMVGGYGFEPQTLSV